MKTERKILIKLTTLTIALNDLSPQSYLWVLLQEKEREIFVKEEG